MLKRRILRHSAQCWLVNTGWVGGPFGVGKRISIAHTRALLNAVLEGKLTDVEYAVDPIFGFRVPQHCEGVPDSVLDPAGSWPSREAYTQRYRDLAARFVENFRKFEADTPLEIVQAGPRLG
jgi:phosphoenolpyruvate carboxykinase (ATP)